MFTTEASRREARTALVTFAPATPRQQMRFCCDSLELFPANIKLASDLYMISMRIGKIHVKSSQIEGRRLLCAADLKRAVLCLVTGAAIPVPAEGGRFVWVGFNPDKSFGSSFFW